MGQNIKFLRKRAGFSQRVLAERLGLKRNNIASYEAGIVEPRALTFIALANFFSVDPVVLLSQSLEEAGTQSLHTLHEPLGSISPREPTQDGPAHDEHAVMEGLREYYQGQKTNQEIDSLLATLSNILNQPE